MAMENEGNLTKWVHIGGMALTPKSPNDWYWVTTGEKVDYDLPWHPDEPNYINPKQMCLALYTSEFLLDDVNCYGSDEGGDKFICQKIISSTSYESTTEP